MTMNYPYVLSDSSEKEPALRLFGLASTIVEGSFYGMSMAKKEKKSFFLSGRTTLTHIAASFYYSNCVCFLWNEEMAYDG